MDGKEGCIALLARNITVNLQNGDGKSDIYTVPVGKKMIVAAVIIRDPTLSLAGATDIDFGDGANADTWRNAISLTTMTTVNDYMYIIPSAATPVKRTIYDAGDVFGVKPVTGAVLNADAKADLAGYLFDA